MPSKPGTKKKKSKLPIEKSRKRLKAKAEFLIHEYVRKRSRDFQGNVQCYTCLKLVPYNKIHAGHYRHGKLDLDLRNLKPQCGFYCNKMLSGNLGRYTLHLIEDYGLEWVKKLDQDADRDTGIKDIRELESIILKYTDLLNQL
ncbi:MAG: hypothetical protein NVSMB66_6390 [Candidatus Doudnabacteria bacterium]